VKTKTFSFDFDERRTYEIRKAIDERANFATHTENTVRVTENEDIFLYIAPTSLSKSSCAPSS